MDDLNQYAISKVLGSTMKPVERGRFGHFGVLQNVSESLKARLAIADAVSPRGGQTQFSYAEDAVVVQAFEEVRDGAAPDALLWNRQLAESFYERCRELGLNAPDAVLARRLLTVRKNSKRYALHGITISPSTKSEPHESIVPRYAHVIEFVLVKLRYRYGVSIDEILLERRLGEMFEKEALALAEDVTPEQLRLGALYIRKSRNYKSSQLEKLQALDVDVIDRAFTEPMSLLEIQPKSISEGPGIIEVREEKRYLYISKNEALRAAVEQFRAGKAFDVVANGFWTPRLENITLQVVGGKTVDGVGVGLWERRLIHDRSPVFNWPIQGEDLDKAA